MRIVTQDRDVLLHSYEKLFTGVVVVVWGWGGVISDVTSGKMTILLAWQYKLRSG